MFHKNVYSKNGTTIFCVVKKYDTYKKIYETYNVGINMNR